MKRLSIFLTFVLSLELLLAQTNIVPNHSFESNSGCPDSQHDFNLVNNWQSAGKYLGVCFCFINSDNPGTPDYFNNCDHNQHPLDNVAISPRSGNGMAGIALFDRRNGELTNYREYMSVQLTQPLIPGNLYEVEFYTATITSNIAIDRMGALFTLSKPRHTSCCEGIDMKPQIEYEEGFTIKEENGWQRIHGVFVPSQPFQWLTIGNFYNDNNTTIFPPNSTDDAYYYVDDVSVINRGISCCIGTERIENTTYFTDFSTALLIPDNVIAGFDAGIPNESGNVIVPAGINVEYKADEMIELRPGFITEEGANFIAEIRNCEEDLLSLPIFTGIPNTFTPNGDGVNDEWCINTSNAQWYHARIDGNWSDPLFFSGFINSDQVCIWDGRRNGVIQEIGAYIYTVTLYNCESATTTQQGVVFIAAGSSKVGETTIPILDIPLDSNSNVSLGNNIFHYPNPATNKLTFEYSPKYVLGDLEIVNVYGEKVIIIPQSTFIETGKVIVNTENLTSGTYFYKFSNGKEKYINKFIIIDK